MVLAHVRCVRNPQTTNLHHAGPSLPGLGASRSYTPRDPEACPLACLLRDHLDDFIARCDDHQHSLPRFVERQLRAITTCGDLTHGFTEAAPPRPALSSLPWAARGAFFVQGEALPFLRGQAHE